MGNSAARQICAVVLLGIPACSLCSPSGAALSQSSRGTGSSASQGKFYRMKMIKAMDEHGFERPIAAKSVLVPTDWQSEGGVTWNVKPYDRCNTTQITLRASGPDGRGIEMYPTYSWVWSDNPTLLRQAMAMHAAVGQRPCDVAPPMTAGDYIRRMLAQVRPNAQLVALEPAPKLMEILQQQARERERLAARHGLKTSVRTDAARARLKYDLSGRPVEEWVYAHTVTTAKPGLGMDPMTMQLTQVYSYDCVAYMTTQRAPAGQLDASDAFFELIFSTARINPEWSARVMQNALAIQQIELKGIRDRSQIVSRSANEIADMQMQGWQNRRRSEDRVADSVAQSIRGVETYRNPATGETIDLSSAYRYAWVNNRGEYLLSDSPNFNPSVALREEWKPLERVGPPAR